MNFRFRSLPLTALALGTLAFASGCEVSKCKTDDGRDATCAESLERYTLDGSDVAGEADYEAGMDLVIEGFKGDIKLVPGDAGIVAANFSPFTYRGHSKDVEAGEDIQTGWEGEVTVDGNTINVTSRRLTDWDEVGATITVWVPPEFDGAIRVVNRSEGNIDEANIDIDAVGSAWSVSMDSRGLGWCDLQGEPTIIDTTATCRGEIEITNVSDTVNAYSDGIASDSDDFAVRVSFAGIAEGAAGGTIESTEGHIELNLPAAGNFVISATTNEDGAINIVNPPADCETTDSSVTCGTDGAPYSVNAGTDDSFDPANVNIDFH